MSEGYAEVKARLDEIVEAVADDDLPLDEALALYEEAVKLGSKVSNLIETDIAERSEREQAQAAQAEGEGAAAADAPTDADAAENAPAESAPVESAATR